MSAVPDLVPRDFMARAIALAEATSAAGHGMAFGAVVVKGGKIIGEGANRIHADHDPTAHGEVRAIQDACRRLGTNDLSGAVIYTSGGAPCPMCATACHWAGLERIYHATDPDRITDAGAPRYVPC
jgi:guanine deaminase